MSLLFPLLSLFVGAVIGWLAAQSRQSAQITALTARLAQTEAQAKTRDEAHAAEMSLLRQSHTEATVQLRQQMERERAQAEATRMADEQKWREQLVAQQVQADRMRAADERTWREQQATLNEQLQKLAAEQFNERQSALQTANRQQLDTLLAPIKAQFADFQRAVEETRKQGALDRERLTTSFESTLRLFEQQQQHAVAQLREETAQIGADAANLTKALKGDSKVQGDWGEMILDKMLENCGLKRGEEYFIQENVRDEQGNNLRPDVVVRFPESRAVVIDSKVSLTAYAAATIADEEAERERLLKAHVASMRKHVDELADKDYSRLVADAIGFVLMFVPNENSYIAAMQTDPTLSQYAYQKHVVIISPSNLLMALKLAYNLWQYDRQTRNVEQIVRRAGQLYDKVANFSESFEGIEAQINNLHRVFEKAKGQLYFGRGNVMAQVEQLREMGITPKKQIKGIETDE